MLLENEWQVTGYWSLNSHFHFFFFTPAANMRFFLHFSCIKVLTRSKCCSNCKVLSPSTFLFVHLFSTDDILHLFPPNGVFLGNRVRQSFQNQSTHKVRSYQSCSLLNSNKLAVTFWVHCFYSDAGQFVIFCFNTEHSISSRKAASPAYKQNHSILCLLSLLSNCLTIFWQHWEESLSFPRNVSHFFCTDWWKAESTYLKNHPKIQPLIVLFLKCFARVKRHKFCY